MATDLGVTAADPAEVVARLSLLDRFLPVWIGAAMVLGVVLGKAFPGLDDALDDVKIDTVSLPIAVGLLAMMYLTTSQPRGSRPKSRDRKLYKTT